MDKDQGIPHEEVAELLRRWTANPLYYALLTSLNLPDTTMLAKTKHKDRATPHEANEIPVTEENKNTATSTSGRGVKALYHKNAPQGFGLNVACSESRISDISVCWLPLRKGGRERAAPTQQKTYLFQPPSSI